jgi:hypothetical protein
MRADQSAEPSVVMNTATREEKLLNGKRVPNNQMWIKDDGEFRLDVVPAALAPK